MAKKLKGLGIEQNSLFYYGKDGSLSIVVREYSAFTVAELGELLPYSVDIGRDCYVRDYEFNGYIRNDIDGRFPLFEIKNIKTEADARAKMLVYLLENKLINI